MVVFDVSSGIFGCAEHESNILFSIWGICTKIYQDLSTFAKKMLTYKITKNIIQHDDITNSMVFACVCMSRMCEYEHVWIWCVNMSSMCEWAACVSSMCVNMSSMCEYEQKISTSTWGDVFWGTQSSFLDFA